MVFRYFRLSFVVLLSVLTFILAGCGSTSNRVVTQKATPGPASCLGGFQTQYGCSAHSPTFGLPPQVLKLTPRSTASTVAMYDSVTVSVLPSGGPSYAGYLFGNFVTYPSLVTGFPTAVHVPIVIHASEVVRGFRMVCLDAEPEDEWPITSAVAGWARAEIQLGVKPCLYSALKNGMAQVEQVLADSGLARSQYLLWDADWTGTPGLDAGFDATQWTDHFENLNVDASAVTRAFLGLIPGPAPVPDIGGAQHYERYPSNAPARPRRERETVRGWDTGNGSGHRCELPLHRASCRVTRSHLIFDLKRDQTLYKRDSKKQRNALHLPGRIQGLSHRINNRRGIVNRWF